MDKKTRNILVIPIEIKVREFLPKLFLAYHVVTKTNFDVYIGGQRFLTRKFKPKKCLWFDKFTYVYSRYKAPFHLDNHVIMQDEEGPISYHNNDIVRSRYSLAQKKFVNHFVFSGKNDLSKIKYLKLKKKEKKIFGLLKLDLLKKRNFFFKPEVENINKKYNNFLFIPGHSSGYRSNEQTRYIFKGKSKNSKVLKNAHNINLNYFKLIDLTIRIAKQNPKQLIIFRRHPNETKENLKKLFKNKPKNIKLIYKYSVTPWILACKYYLHSGCQTSLEAIASNKKIITYMPYKSYPNVNWKFTRPFFDNEKKCLNFFKNLNKNKKKFFLSQRTKSIAYNLKLNNYYVKNFVNFLKREYSYDMKSELQKSDDAKQNFLIKKILKFASNIKSFLVERDIYFKFIPNHYYVSKEAKERKFKSIKFDEMQKYLSYIIKIYGNRTELKLKKMSDSAFLIMNKNI
jgi:surface carbohydrate biosynthesis protein